MLKLFSNLRWILLPLTIFIFVIFIEAATDEYGISSSEEGIMYLTWGLIIINAGLFIFNQKWQKLIKNWF